MDRSQKVFLAALFIAIQPIFVSAEKKDKEKTSPWQPNQSAVDLYKTGSNKDKIDKHSTFIHVLNFSDDSKITDRFKQYQNAKEAKRQRNVDPKIKTIIQKEEGLITDDRNWFQRKWDSLWHKEDIARVKKEEQKPQEIKRVIDEV